MARKSVQTVDSDLKSHERECEVRYQSILSQLEKMDKRIFRMEGLILDKHLFTFLINLEVLLTNLQHCQRQ